MGLTHVVAAVEQQLQLVLEQPSVNLPMPKMAIGLDKISHQEAPPRMVWIPQRGSVRGPHGQGGDGVINPRPLWTRHLGVLVHIWAEDSSKPDGSGDVPMVEAYMQHLVAAIHDMCHGAYAVVSEDWPASIQGQTTNLGAVCLLGLELQLPLTREPDTYATIETITTATAIDPIVT
jgi:hypothetical protein